MLVFPEAVAAFKALSAIATSVRDVVVRDPRESPAPIRTQEQLVAAFPPAYSVVVTPGRTTFAVEWTGRWGVRMKRTERPYPCSPTDPDFPELLAKKALPEIKRCRRAARQLRGDDRERCGRSAAFELHELIEGPAQWMTA